MTFRGDVRRCCEAGIPGVYTGGTSGEFYAIEIDEFAEISRAAIDEGHAGNTPVMIGCSATSTTGAARRAQIAADLGADAIQVTLPFWMEVADAQIVEFFQTVAEVSGGLPFSVYETARCKRTLTVEQHREIAAAVPSYLMVKSNAGTIGATADGCRELSEFVNVFVAETRWSDLGPCGARGACSAMVYWNPARWSWNDGRVWRKPTGQRSIHFHEKRRSPCTAFSAAGSAHAASPTAPTTGFAGARSAFSNAACSVGARIHMRCQRTKKTVRDWCLENFPEMLS